MDLRNLSVLVYSTTNVSIPMVKQGKRDIKFAFVSHLVQKLWPKIAFQVVDILDLAAILVSGVVGSGTLAK